MTVAQRFPASRETVENSAAAKASPNPTRASRNFAHTSAAGECSHRNTGPEPEALDFNEPAYGDCTDRSLASVGDKDQSALKSKQRLRNSDGETRPVNPV